MFLAESTSLKLGKKAYDLWATISPTPDRQKGKNQIDTKKIESEIDRKR